MQGSEAYLLNTHKPLKQSEEGNIGDIGDKGDTSRTLHIVGSFNQAY